MMMMMIIMMLMMLDLWSKVDTHRTQQGKGSKEDQRGGAKDRKRSREKKMSVEDDGGTAS